MLNETITLTTFQLRDLLDDQRELFEKHTEKALRVTVEKTLADTGLVKPYMKKSEACRLYGRANVERWIADGVLTTLKDSDVKNAQVRISRTEIAVVAMRWNTPIQNDMRRRATEKRRGRPSKAVYHEIMARP